jgi:nicotinate-nucleotide adenylyltransferase
VKARESRASLCVLAHPLPPHAPGMRIGLLGGSFDPPHLAHRAISLFALKRLNLDRIWWLVTPGNPLKDNTHLAPLEERIGRAGALARDPRIVVSGLEAVIGAHYTVDTVSYLRRRCPRVRFVWIMGADSLADYHRWKGWRKLANLVPIAVIDRGARGLRALSGKGARALARYRISEARAERLADLPPPAWVFLHGLRLSLSSTELRARAGVSR